MIRVGNQCVAIQMIGKYLLAFGNGFCLGHLLKAKFIPCFIGTFDNHRRGVIVKLIGMYPNPAMLGLLKNKGKRLVEFLFGAQPDKFANPRVYVRFKMLRIFIAHQRINAIGGDHKIVFLAVFFS